MAKRSDSWITKKACFSQVLYFLFCIVYSPLSGAVESKRLLSFHFDKIEVRGNLNVFAQPGKRNREIEYFADESIINEVSAKVHNRTLFLDANNSLSLNRRIPFIRLSAKRLFPVEVVVSIDQLDEIRLFDHSNLRIQNISGKNLNLFVSSTGSLHATNLGFENISLKHEGAGDVVLKGREVVSLNAELRGSGSLHCEELFLDEAKIRHFGSGQAFVAPSLWLDAEINYTGDLHLLESPSGKVIKNKELGGRVIEP